MHDPKYKDHLFLHGNRFIFNNPALVIATLPATSSVGNGGWQIAQNAGQTIHFDNQDTTTGVGDSLDSTNLYDAIQLLCTAANTSW